jgi:hypothetical protein
MGGCHLTFDRIVIQNQKSDTKHFDTDWLHLVWFTGGPGGPQPIQVTIPLLNIQGSFHLHTGDVIPPLPFAGNANDTDVVMAVYAITNLGSSDWSDQANQAAQITNQIAQSVTDVYLTAARMVLEAIASDVTGIVWINVVTENLVDPNWNSIINVVNSAIDAAFNGVINPVLDWVANQFANLFGSPNCNGEVLHDYVIFVPNSPNDGSLHCTYTGSQRNSSCGEAPHTEVDITMHRDAQLIGQFGPVIQPNQNDSAAREFRNRAEIATQEGYVGAFPNFYYGMAGQAHTGGTIFIKPSCGQWMDVPWVDLGYPPLGDFASRMRATDVYATRQGYAGGFPNFFQAQRLSGLIGAGSALPVTATSTSSVFPFFGSAHPEATVTVCGTVLIKEGCGVRRDIPLVDLGDITDIGSLFRSVQDYATKNGFVGGFPTYNFAVTGPGTIRGRGPALPSMIVVLLTSEAAVWQDVVLYWNPS